MKYKNLSAIILMCLCTIIITSCNSNKIDREKLSEALLKYDSFSDFSDGVSVVEKNGKYGLIDLAGKEVVPCIYDYISDFLDGFAAVEKDDKLGYIDKTGKEVVPCIYSRFSDTLIRTFHNDLVAVSKNDKMGFVDKSGKEIIPCIYDESYNSYTLNDIFSEGLVRVSKDGNFGFIDKQGKTIVPFVYGGMHESRFDFSEGMALVSHGFIESEGGWRYGFVDKSGKEVIPCIYENGSPFSEGLACMQKNGKYGFIDKNGKEVIPFIYNMEAEGDDVSFSTCFKNGIVILRVNDGSGSSYSMDGEGKFGAIDKTGKIVISFRYDDLSQIENSNLFLYSINEKYGIMDKSEKEIIPCIYDWIGGDYITEGNYLIASLNGKQCFLDNKTGVELFSFNYDAIRGFSEGLVEVEKNDKWGFIDKTGKEIIPVIFNKYELNSFSNGLAKAKWNNQEGFVDKDGYFIGKGFVKKISELNAVVGITQDINMDMIVKYIRENTGDATFGDILDKLNYDGKNISWTGSFDFNPCFNMYDFGSGGLDMSECDDYIRLTIGPDKSTDFKTYLLETEGTTWWYDAKNKYWDSNNSTYKDKNKWDLCEVIEAKLTANDDYNPKKDFSALTGKEMEQVIEMVKNIRIVYTKIN